jgi:hypothetical protein
MGIDVAFSTIFLLDFGTVPTVWYICAVHFIPDRRVRFYLYVFYIILSYFYIYHFSIGFWDFTDKYDLVFCDFTDKYGLVFCDFTDKYDLVFCDFTDKYDLVFWDFTDKYGLVFC